MSTDLVLRHRHTAWMSAWDARAARRAQAAPIRRLCRDQRLGSAAGKAASMRPRKVSSASPCRIASPAALARNSGVSSGWRVGAGTARNMAAIARAALMGSSFTGSQIGLVPKWSANGSFLHIGGLTTQKSPVARLERRSRAECSAFTFHLFAVVWPCRSFEILLNWWHFHTTFQVNCQKYSWTIWRIQIFRCRKWLPWRVFHWKLYLITNEVSFAVGIDLFYRAIVPDKTQNKKGIQKSSFESQFLKENQLQRHKFAS